MDKIALKTITSIQENWAGRNFMLTASLVNSQLIIRMQECRDDDLKSTTTNGFNFEKKFIGILDVFHIW